MQVFRRYSGLNLHGKDATLVTISSCLQWFAAVDTDRSGKISVNELQQALALGNLHFSLAVCAQMIRSAVIGAGLSLGSFCA